MGHQKLSVLELGDAHRSAYCGLLFSQWGAEVTAVGRGTALPLAARLYLDRGKAVSTAAASSEGRWDVVLAPDAEAVVSAFGMAPQELADRAGGPVVGIATLFGDSAAYATLTGGEPEAFALSGLMSMIGEPDREPLRLGGSQAENAAAASLFTGVWLALYQRGSTGRGSVVRTSAVRSTAYLDWKSQIHFAEEGKVLQRGNTNGPLVLRCADGHVGFYYRDEEWDAVKRLVGDPRLDDPRFASQLERDRHRDELMDIVEPFSLALTKRELYHAAQRLKIPAGEVLTLPELPGDPQLAARAALGSDTGSDGDGDGRPFSYPRAPWTIDSEREDAR